jgi:hypothetical protein
MSRTCISSPPRRVHGVVAYSLLYSINIKPFKAKAVPLHAMEAFGERGVLAPTHSRPRHQIGVSG